MTIQLQYTESLTGSGSISDQDTGVRQIGAWGTSVLPSQELSFTNGTGNFQANNWYMANRTLAATTFDNLNLTSGLTNFGGTLAFTKIKYVRLAILSPDGTKLLRVGPQGQTNAWQGPFGGVGATDYVEFGQRWDTVNSYAGWSVTSGSADVLSIYNPGADPVTYSILLIGIV